MSYCPHFQLQLDTADPKIELYAFVLEQDGFNQVPSACLSIRVPFDYEPQDLIHQSCRIKWLDTLNKISHTLYQGRILAIEAQGNSSTQETLYRVWISPFSDNLRQTQQRVFVQTTIQNLLQKHLQSHAHDTCLLQVSAHKKNTLPLAFQWNENNVDFIDRLCRAQQHSFMVQHQETHPIIRCFANTELGTLSTTAPRQLQYHSLGSGVYAEVDGVLDYACEYTHQGQIRLKLRTLAADIQLTDPILFSIPGHPHLPQRFWVIQRSIRIQRPNHTQPCLVEVELDCLSEQSVWIWPPYTRPLPDFLYAKIESHAKQQSIDRDEQGCYWVRFEMDGHNPLEQPASPRITQIQPLGGPNHAFDFALSADTRVIVGLQATADGGEVACIIGVVPEPLAEPTLYRHTVCTRANLAIEIEDAPTMASFTCRFQDKHRLVFFDQPKQASIQLHSQTGNLQFKSKQLDIQTPEQGYFYSKTGIEWHSQTQGEWHSQTTLQFESDTQILQSKQDLRYQAEESCLETNRIQFRSDGDIQIHSQQQIALHTQSLHWSSTRFGIQIQSGGTLQCRQGSHCLYANEQGWLLQADTIRIKAPRLVLSSDAELNHV